jgi:hypothetical protein
LRAVAPSNTRIAILAFDHCPKASYNGYSGLSLPYHIGNGWFGGFLPACLRS